MQCCSGARGLVRSADVHELRTVAGHLTKKRKEKKNNVMNAVLQLGERASQVGECPQTEDSGWSLDKKKEGKKKEQCDECSFAAGRKG